MRRSDSSVSNAVDQLCPACGLCCNGTLFADVELQRGDSPTQLRAAGIRVEAKGRKLAFAQPCHCFDGKLCRIYPERPTRCRTFECRLLLQVNAGHQTPLAALKKIQGVRRQLDQVQALLRALGNEEEHLPIAQRYRTVMVQPIELAGSEIPVQLRAKLGRAMDQLMRTLQREFLSGINP